MLNKKLFEKLLYEWRVGERIEGEIKEFVPNWIELSPAFLLLLGMIIKHINSLSELQELKSIIRELWTMRVLLILGATECVAVSESLYPLLN